jgi:hypothetical protein
MVPDRGPPPRPVFRAATRQWRLNHRVYREALLDAAVANNALWCDAVCRSHGYPGVFSARLWISAQHGLEFYPNVITLRPEVTAAETALPRDRSGRYAVKDSFARLDLSADGLRTLFEAEWIARTPAPAGPGEPGLSWNTVTDAGELGRWETAWSQGDSTQGPLFRPELLADPHCVILAGRRDGDLAAGIIACIAAGVTGISNLFGAGLPSGQLWTSALRAVAALRPHLPIVGYEHGAGLAAARRAGCQTLGPLRVWTRNPVR